MATKFITSPKGSTKFAWLTEPDTKFDAAGVYQTDLVVPAEEAAPFIEKMEELFENAWKAECQTKGKKLKKAALPWDENEEDGTVSFKFKLKASIETKKGTMVRKPALFDAKGKPLNPKTIKIGNGSVVKISFTPYLWFSPSVGFGLQLQIAAAQIIELKEWAGGDRDYGFGQEEGYEGSDASADDESAGFGFDDDNDEDAPAAGGSDDEMDF